MWLKIISKLWPFKVLEVIFASFCANEAETTHCISKKKQSNFLSAGSHPHRLADYISKILYNHYYLWSRWGTQASFGLKERRQHQPWRTMCWAQRIPHFKYCTMLEEKQTTCTPLLKTAHISVVSSHRAGSSSNSLLSSRERGHQWNPTLNQTCKLKTRAKI